MATSLPNTITRTVTGRTLKMAWFKRGRYALTVVAIALSVAFIVSTMMLTTSISNVGEPLADAYAGTDTHIQGAEVAQADGPAAAVIQPVPTSVVGDLTAAGYEAVGFSQTYAQVIDTAGNPAGRSIASENVAVAWLGESDLNAFEIVEGAAPLTADQVVLDVTTATDAGYSVGDTVTFVSGEGVASAELVGTASFGGADNEPYVATMLFEPAHPVLDTPADSLGFDYVLVAGDASPADTTAAVAAALPGLEVSSGPEWVDAQVAEMDDFLGFFTTFLTVFAAVAVVVGMVIVANTFTVSLAQRTQELATQRLVGTTRRQLLQQVVIEAGALGVAGTAIGVVLGMFGVEAMGWMLDVLGMSIERSDATSGLALAIGAVVGIGVTIFAAVRPAWQASAVAPIEALRSADIEPPSASTRRIVATAGLAAVGVAALAFGVAEASALWVGVGIGGLFLALYLGAEFLIRGVARLARPLLARGGPSGTVASRNLERNAGRTSAAASALMIGVALIAFFTLMAATIGQMIAGDSADNLSADYVVQGVGDFAEPVISETAIANISAADGVELVVPMYQTGAVPAVPTEAAGPAGSTGAAAGTLPASEAGVSTDGSEQSSSNSFGREAVFVAFTDVDGLAEVYDTSLVAGSLDAVAASPDSAVVVVEATAAELGLSVGDTLELSTRNGPAQVEVAAIAANSLPGFDAPAVIGEVALADTFGYDGAATSVFVNAAASETELQQAIAMPTLDVQTTPDYIDGLGGMLNTMLALVYAMLAVAVVIALVGIANTVSLAISERAGEVAAMRAAGSSMRQIFWSLIAEFGLLASVGVGAGLGLAWVSATAMFRAISDDAVTWAETDISTGLWIAAAGLIGGALAAWWPARKASRNDILDVLRAS